MIADRLQVLQARFVERSRGDAVSLTEALTTGDLDLIRSVAHRLAGGGGTLGLPAVSVAAAALEERCDAGDLPAVGDAVRELRAVIDALA